MIDAIRLAVPIYREVPESEQLIMTGVEMVEVELNDFVEELNAVIKGKKHQYESWINKYLVGLNPIYHKVIDHIVYPDDEEDFSEM